MSTATFIAVRVTAAAATQHKDDSASNCNTLAAACMDATVFGRLNGRIILLSYLQMSSGAAGQGLFKKPMKDSV